MVSFTKAGRARTIEKTLAEIQLVEKEWVRLVAKCRSLTAEVLRAEADARALFGNEPRVPVSIQRNHFQRQLDQTCVKICEVSRRLATLKEKLKKAAPDGRMDVGYGVKFDVWC